MLARSGRYYYSSRRRAEDVVSMETKGPIVLDLKKGEDLTSDIESIYYDDAPRDVTRMNNFDTFATSYLFFAR